MRGRTARSHLLQSGLFSGIVQGSAAKFDFSRKIEFLVAIDSMTYRIPHSSKTNFATEPLRVPYTPSTSPESKPLDFSANCTRRISVPRIFGFFKRRIKPAGAMGVTLIVPYSIQEIRTPTSHRSPLTLCLITPVVAAAKHSAGRGVRADRRTVRVLAPD